MTRHGRTGRHPIERDRDIPNSSSDLDGLSIDFLRPFPSAPPQPHIGGGVGEEGPPKIGGQPIELPIESGP